VPGCGCAKRLGYTSWRAGGSNLPAVRALVAMLAVGVAGAGCGGGSFDEQPPAKPGIYTSLAIAEHFKRETGDTLVPGRVRGRGLESLEAPDESLLASKYGLFSIYVVTSDPKRVRYLIGGVPDAQEKVEGPDSHGTYWTRTCPPKSVGACFWLVQRRYGRNVVLTWMAGSQRKTDARFARLTSALESLP